jgi:uncharacterized protein
MIVALWSRERLAADSGVEDPGGWGSVSSPEQVDRVIAEAQAAGARIARTGTPTFWSGYSGVFVDPDGYPWEIAHNPHWTLTADGAAHLSHNDDGPPEGGP